ncbi:MAG TPA: chloride channel protein [Gemmatirosa sp.]
MTTLPLSDRPSVLVARARRLLAARAPSEYSILVGFAVVIGTLTAVGVAAFYGAIDLAYAAFFRWSARAMPRLGLLAYRPVVTGAGFALAWWIIRTIGRGHDGMNVPDVQLAVARRGADVPTRPALARTLASAVTIGASGSAGSEGPVVVLGAALGSALGRAFRAASSRTTVLVACGAGAAISAAFNAPLAGAFFALEAIVGTFSGTSFAPVVVASVIAAVVSRAAFGNHPAFPIPAQYTYAGTGDALLGFPLLGLACGLMAALFVRTYFAADDIARVLRVPRAAKPWIGGALVGALVALSGGTLVGYGHLAIHLDMFGRMTWWALAALALGKVLATSVTLNFGGSGGVFTPSLYIGAATGGALGVALTHVFPHAGLHPETYALVGMGAMIAGATDAPITGILLVFEMTNDYAMVLPLMLAVVVCHRVSRRLVPDSLYSGWLRRRGETLGHGEDPDALAGVRVGDVYDVAPIAVTEDTPVASLLEQLGHTDQPALPVVDADGRVTGVITPGELARAARDASTLGDLVIAADLARPSETVAAGDSLLVAVRQLGVRGASALPVVDPTTGRLSGLLTRAHVLAAYERAVSAGGPDPHASPGRRTDDDGDEPPAVAPAPASASSEPAAASRA